MGTTTNGFPYPESSDPVAEGAQAIQALAQAVDTKLRLASGTQAVTITAVGTQVSTAVTFPVGRFSAVPNVVTNPNFGRPDQFDSSVMEGSATSSGFTLRSIRTTGTVPVDITVGWIAHQTA